MRRALHFVADLRRPVPMQKLAEFPFHLGRLAWQIERYEMMLR